MLLPNPWRLVAVLVVAGALSGGSFVFGVKYANGRQARDEVLIAKVREEAQLGAADAIAKIQVRHTTIRQKVEETVREVPVYRDCINDSSVERLLDDARANRDPKPANDSAVP